MQIINRDSWSKGLVADFEELWQRWLSPDPFFHLQTSGSTGPPQSIPLRKTHMRHSAAVTLKYLQVAPGSKVLACLPLNKIGGFMNLVRAEVGGLQLHLQEPSPEPLADAQGNFDLVSMVPFQAQRSLPELHRVKHLLIGGGPLNPALEEALRSHSQKAYHTFGMTETISHVALRPLHGNKPTPFRALPGVGFSVDKRSCLIIHAPERGVEKLQTKDVVELLDEHSFTWLGRWDNVVNTAGNKLFPEFLEKKLTGLPVPYFLASLPDPERGEKLVLILESEKDLPAKAVKKYTNLLAPYEQPREWHYCPRFSYTTNGKIQRAATLQRMGLTKPQD